MWKNIYQKLNYYHKNLTVKEYCDAFLKLVNPNDKIWTVEDVNYYLSINNTSDFFPETKNLHHYINDGDYSFLVNYVYHFPKTEKYWFDTDGKLISLDEYSQYKIIFDESSDLYLLKKSIFMPEILLSKDDINRQLTYLFLFFLPLIENYGMLYHYKKKIPLLCCNEITNENFNMVLHLMKEYDSFGINLLSANKNLNHLLVEDFMENSQKLYAFDTSTNWDKVLPIYKIHTLLDMNCNFKTFEEKMAKKFHYTFENMPKILLELEKKYFYLKLDMELSKKQIFKKTLLKL